MKQTACHEWSMAASCGVEAELQSIGRGKELPVMTNAVRRPHERMGEG